MGYYTQHKLEVIDGKYAFHGQYQKEIEEIADYENLFDESAKWYDHEADMREFSKLHPTTTFKLIGEGEDAGDMWHEYYRNGKMQRCKSIVTYEPFDENKLI